jgi:2-C-methyl-D-erythritol 4-phosphate cytidylyltransferase
VSSPAGPGGHQQDPADPGGHRPGLAVPGEHRPALAGPGGRRETPAVPGGRRSGPAGGAWAIVVAGGNGTRFGARKQYATLAGRRLVDWSLEAARRACAGVVLVLPADDLPPATLGAPSPWPADAVVAGGVKRSDSVRAGLAAVPAGVEIIAVHDAARPLAGPELWLATIAAVRRGADAAIPTIPVTDTVKSVAQDGSLVTLDRSALWAVQTPQAFAATALRQAHAGGGDATDDAALVETLGGRVVRVAGHPRNLKVTHPDDLLVAAALLPVFLSETGLAGAPTPVLR